MCFNLNFCVTLDNDVTNKIWFDKNVSAHSWLQIIFAYSKGWEIEVGYKVKECNFIDYGEDEFGYKFYDFV